MRSRKLLVTVVLAGIALAVLVAAPLLVGHWTHGDILRSLITKQVREATGRRFEVNGPLHLTLGRPLSIRAESVSLGNAPWGSQPQMASARAIQVQVALLPLLRGDIQVRRIALDQPEILLETNRAGAVNWDFKRTREAGAMLGSMVMRRGTVIYRSAGSAEVRLRLARLEAHRIGEPGAVAIEGEGQYRGQPLSLHGTVARIGSSERPAAYRIQGEGDWAGMIVNFNGAIKAAGQAQDGAESGTHQKPEPGLRTAGLDLKLNLSGPSPAALGPLLDLSILASDPLQQPYQILGRLVRQGDDWSLHDLQIKAGRTEISGSVSAQIDNSGLSRVRARLASPRIDLNPWLSALEKRGTQDADGRKTAAQTADGGSQGDRWPVDEWINRLHAVEGDMELRAVEVLHSGNSIRDLSLHARTSGDRERPLVLQGQGKYRGERLALAARIGAHQGPEKNLFPIDIEGGLGDTRFNLAGTIAADGKINTLKFRVRGSHLARLSRFSGVKTAPDVTYRASGTLSRSERGWTLSDLDAVLGDSDFVGDLKVSLAEGERPRVTGKLRSSKLALDEIKQFWHSKAAGEGRDGEPHSSDRHSSDSALSRFDANVDWRAGEVTLSVLSVKNVDTNVQWDHGRLVLKPLDIDFAGGRLSARLNIDDSHEPPPRLSGRLTMRRANLATLLKALNAEPKAQGRIGGDLDFSTRTGSLQEMLAALDGRLDLVMESGRIDSELLSKIALDLGKLIFSGVVKDETRIDCFVARFAIHDGHMHAEALLLSTPNADVTGRGNIDLRTQAVKLTLTPHPKGPGIGRSSGPVHIGGTLKHRTASADTSDVAAGGVAAALGAVVNPLLALIPLAHMGNEDEDVCQRAITLVGRPGTGERH